MTYKKKLIEVALPLEAINAASGREKSIRHGHPSTLHLWWARRPLAAARAVIFSQMVDDPSSYAGTLLADPVKRRAAERDLKKRRAAWTNRSVLFEEALAGGDLAVPEPGPAPTLEECIADLERERLFDIIRDLVKWESTNNELVLQAARDEIWQSWRRTCAESADHPRARELFDRHTLPAFHDPFAGGGAIPLEAQRLGLAAFATDLNPVAVLINKAMIEIPPKFANRQPVNPGWQSKSDGEKALSAWTGARGLAEDVRWYGQWMRDEAERRIGHLYPKVQITEQMLRGRPDLKSYVGEPLTVVAWLWARTVRSPNPAFANVHVPLASTFVVSAKKGEEAFVHPVLDGLAYTFEVRAGKSADPAITARGTKLARGANFCCLMSGAPISPDYVATEATNGRMGARLMAIVAESDKGRVYLSPMRDQEEMAASAAPHWQPEVEMPANPRWFSPPRFGLMTYGSLFSPRQLVAMETFCEIVRLTRQRVAHDVIDLGGAAKVAGLGNSTTSDLSYPDAVGILLAFTLSRLADRCSSICSWDLRDGQGRKSGIRNVFSRQAVPMVWDFAEANPLSEIAASMASALGRVADVLDRLPATGFGTAFQLDAAQQTTSIGKVVSTDPPYYDNIGYADLSDYFYVWLRRALQPLLPELFATVAVPKSEELVATPYRHGGKSNAEAFFLDGMTNAMHRLAEQAHPAFPVTIYYAFKQAESDGADGTTNTGWDTFLGAVIQAGFAISGTWPMRTELSNRMIGSGTNALASSIVLVCRPRPANASAVTRREFVAALKSELPLALAHLQRGNIAPVDLAQAAIGPGMAVYTRYSSVFDAVGKPLTVREALTLINQTLDEALAEQEGDFDADSRWALTWFEQVGFAEGEFGLAEQLSKSKNTSVAGMVEAGIVFSGRSKVRLLKPSELSVDWDPTTDQRVTAWEMVHQLVRALEAGGESAAAVLIGKLGSKAEIARELSYRLYTLCERKKRAAEALSYNALVQSWPEVSRIAALAESVLPASATAQTSFL